MNYTNTFFNSLLHLLYPRVCAGCGSDLIGKGQLICLDCIEELPLTGFHYHAANPIEKLFWGRLLLDAATSLLYFTPRSVIQRLLHRLKYKGHKELGYYFGRRMGEALLESGRFTTIDALVPLPLYAKRQKQRGYNQAGLLCEGMAEVMQLPVIADAVARKSYTETQTRKNRMQRWSNIEGKFELINPHAVEGKHILLVDDVLTTGATLEACGTELLKAENARLSIATLAYTSL